MSSLRHGELTLIMACQETGKSALSELMKKFPSGVFGEVKDFSMTNYQQQGEVKMSSVKYLHLRKYDDFDGEVNPRGGLTVAFSELNGVFGVAISICNPTDNYVRKEGRKIATERLMNKEARFYGELAVQNISDLADDIIEFAINKLIPQVEELAPPKPAVAPAPKTITIDEAEYDKLFEAYHLLNCLRNAGVDNWDGWDDAIEAYQKESAE